VSEPWRSQSNDARVPRPDAPARRPGAQSVAAMQAAVAAAMQTEPAHYIGRVIGVSGYSTQLELQSGMQDAPRAEIGSLVKVRAQDVAVVGVISSMTVQPAGKDGEKTILELVLVGEVGGKGFQRGVAHFPVIGDDVYLASATDLAYVFTQAELVTLNVGTLYQDQTVPARLLADDLFSKHFAIVGTTGCGKSSALTCILREALKERPHGHVLLLDMHGEYRRAFGASAEVIGAGDLHLPYWLLSFQELRSVLTSPDDHQDAQAEILCDAVIMAKKRFSDATASRLRTRVLETAAADNPTPFRLSDLTGYIDEQLGKLERPHPTLAYRRLKSRIETLTTDPRYAFMFGNPNIEDTMVDILARLFRVPNDGRPITVVELSTVPEDVLDVVVLLLSRLTFDLAVWSEGKLPVLLVCEEAHRYVSADERKGFFPTRLARSRIAKEGRKYGISLALLTQRPSELDATILSQCSTILAMRLSTESDQKVMRANAHDSTFGILEYLPLLADREAIVLGRGAPMPMRIKFADLPRGSLPGKDESSFTARWATPNMTRQILEDTVARWRSNTSRKA
jgi:DNA helicase HerA-like ATPase